MKGNDAFGSRKVAVANSIADVAYLANFILLCPLPKSPQITCCPADIFWFNHGFRYCFVINKETSVYLTQANSEISSMPVTTLDY